MNKIGGKNVKETTKKRDNDDDDDDIGFYRF